MKDLFSPRRQSRASKKGKQIADKKVSKIHSNRKQENAVKYLFEGEGWGEQDQWLRGLQEADEAGA